MGLENGIFQKSFGYIGLWLFLLPWSLSCCGGFGVSIFRRGRSASDDEREIRSEV